MFFRKKPNALKPKLEEALKLVERTHCLASAYLYEPDYEPTEAEKALFAELTQACQRVHASIRYISQMLQKHDMPEPKRSVLSAYTSP